MSSSASTGAAGGAGGDKGMPSDTYPAFHPTLPTIVKGMGSVVAAPKIVPVYFASDDPAITSAITGLTSQLGASTYWGSTTSEYGVGPATALPPASFSETPPPKMDDVDVRAWLTTKLNANDTGLPAADADTIYVLVYPANTAITLQGATTCKDLGAYHEAGALDAAHANLPIHYAVIPHCTNFNGFGAVDFATIAVAHELIETATDPAPDVSSGWSGADEDHLVWPIQSGNEICDFCDTSPASYEKVTGIDFLVERCWSNKAAIALHDPCVPAAPTLPYFNSAPVLKDTIHYMTLTFPGVIVPVGATRDVELDLFSEAKTSGPWTVTAEDLAPTFGGAPELAFTFDRTAGQNGEKIYVSVTAKKKAASGFSVFVLKSTLGTETNTWVVPVGNQ